MNWRNPKTKELCKLLPVKKATTVSHNDHNSLISIIAEKIKERTGISSVEIKVIINSHFIFISSLISKLTFKDEEVVPYDDLPLFKLGNFGKYYPGFYKYDEYKRRYGIFKMKKELRKELKRESEKILKQIEENDKDN